MENWSKVIKE